MDLGGGSVQIIFVPEHPNPEYSETVRLFGHDYQTYSESFLCYGTDQANLIYRANMAKDQALMANCLPFNATAKLSQQEISQSPCINGGIYENDRASTEFVETSHVFAGMSDYNGCVRDVDKIFYRTQTCKIGTDYCSFKDAFISNVKPSKFMVRRIFKIIDFLTKETRLKLLFFFSV